MQGMNINDDYASVNFDGTIYAYYGYEEQVGVGHDAEWAFVYFNNNKKILLGRSNLVKRFPNLEDETDPIVFLAAGLAVTLEASVNGHL